MTKQEIINLTEEIGKKVVKLIDNKSEFINDRMIGNNQFRSIANTCNNADCFEEIELMVKYNIAKADDKSWALKIEGETLGNSIIKCMNTIKNNSEKDKCLNNLALFFGYMYWQSRIWSSMISKSNYRQDNYKKR